MQPSTAAAQAIQSCVSRWQANSVTMGEESRIITVFFSRVIMRTFHRDHSLDCNWMIVLKWKFHWINCVKSLKENSFIVLRALNWIITSTYFILIFLHRTGGPFWTVLCFNIIQILILFLGQCKIFLVLYSSACVINCCKDKFYECLKHWSQSLLQIMLS